MIKLTTGEQKLFKLFMDFVKAKQLELTLRVAGGWVRDKILGRESTMDIDIALDNIMGKSFAEQLHAHLQSENIESHGFGVIQSNPEKSKHLETATIKIFDFWVDFVNLRGEEYSEDSRVPVQRMGTPVEDAFRRDFTINSLFYNINKAEVEDLTQMGLSDLSGRLIRTPLDPYKTFLDDPLRVLRGFRFAARYGFDIEPVTAKASSDLKIKEAFTKKISRERIGLEFMANFKNWEQFHSPFRFFELLHISDFWPLLVDIPDPVSLDQSFRRMRTAYHRMPLFKDELRALEALLLDRPNINEILSFSELAQFTLLSIFLYDRYDPLQVLASKQAAYQFVVNSIKVGNKFANFMVHLQRALNKLSALHTQNPKLSDIRAVAIWQREAGDLWKLAELVFNAVFLDQSKGESRPFDVSKFLNERSLLDFHRRPPLFNGTEIKQIFKVDGRAIKLKQDEILLWQIDNPNATKQDFLSKP